MARPRCIPALLATAVAVLALPACGSSSSSSKSAADVAVCKQINADIQRLIAQSQSHATEQNLAKLAGTDRATATKLRALMAAPGISMQLKSALTNAANTIDAVANLQSTAAQDPSRVLQTEQQFAVDVHQLQSACK